VFDVCGAIDALNEVFGEPCVITGDDGTVIISDLPCDVEFTVVATDSGDEGIDNYYYACDECGPVECPPGFELNDAMQCTAIECEDGYHYDQTEEACVPDEEHECPSGEVWDPQTGACVSTECPDGQYFDTDSKSCLPGCDDDSDCQFNEYCQMSTHSCEPLDCGLIEDHELLETWECGSYEENPACGPCPQGFVCLDYQCVQGNISGDDCIVDQDCSSEIEVEKAPGYVVVKGPDGQVVAEGPMTDGAFKFIPAVAGAYAYELYDVRGGVLLDTDNVVAVVRGEPTPDALSTLAKLLGEALPFLALMLISILALLLYWRRRGEKPPARAGGGKAAKRK